MPPLWPGRVRSREGHRSWEGKRGWRGQGTGCCMAGTPSERVWTCPSGWAARASARAGLRFNGHVHLEAWHQKEILACLEARLSRLQCCHRVVDEGEILFILNIHSRGHSGHPAVDVLGG